MKNRFTIKENIALAPLTTLKIGGTARFFARAETESDVVVALEFAREKSLDVFILGGGSNVIISDEGFPGLVLKIALMGISSAGSLPATKPNAFETVSVTAQAGENWDDFVRFCVDENLAGVECLSGIPGLVGGTPIQNVGAYGQEVSETIQLVRCFDRKTKCVVELTNSQFGFRYRESVFNTTERNRFIVLAVTFSLAKNGAPKIAYKDLKEYFAGTTSAPTLAETREAILEIRRAKSMVIDERDENSRSVGSFFKNPIITLEEYYELDLRAREMNLLREEETIPKFVADAAHVKVPAAWLIDRSGFQKGHRKGSVGISTKHNLAIINCGGAKAHEISELKSEIQSAVKEKFGIVLFTEPIFVGSF